MGLWRRFLAWLWDRDMTPGLFHPPLGSGDDSPPPPPLAGRFCDCACHHTESGDLAEATRHRDLAEQREQPDRVGRFAEERFVAAQAIGRRLSLSVVGPPLDIESVAYLACGRCAGRHAVIFSGRPAELSTVAPPRRPKAAQPWRDSDSNVVIPPPRETDTGGATDGGEGPE